jgi:hypothetical protein
MIENKIITFVRQRRTRKNEMTNQNQIMTSIFNNSASMFNLAMAELEKSSKTAAEKANTLIASGATVMAKVEVYPEPKIAIYVQERNGTERLIALFNARQELAH